jgi:hypothetical protein
MTSNGPQVAAKIHAKGIALSAAIDRATKNSAVLLKADLLRTTPVREVGGNNPYPKGHLRKGWEGPTSKGKWEYEVSNPVEYAMYVEKGTYKMAGRHFTENAVHRIEPIHKAGILAAIKVIL